MTRARFYVVWRGHAPGVYQTWDECKAQIAGFTRAQFKSYSSRFLADAAFRAGGPDKVLMKAPREAWPDGISVDRPALTVDGACAGAGGPGEYRGVLVPSGREVFKMGPYQGSTNNLMEYLAIAMGLLWCEERGMTDMPIYSDSMVAIGWAKSATPKTTAVIDEASPLAAAMAAATNYLQSKHANLRTTNRLVKWDTGRYGEIPADFGRK